MIWCLMQNLILAPLSNYCLDKTIYFLQSGKSNGQTYHIRTYLSIFYHTVDYSLKSSISDTNIRSWRRYAETSNRFYNSENKKNDN